MKTYKILIVVLFLSLLFLAGCDKSDKVPAANPAQNSAAVDFSNMTEDERTQAMIKMIEAKEAEMKTNGETK
jgi:uncharacterized lipoprotein YajG